MPWRPIRETPDSWFSAECAVCHTGTESRTLWLDGDIEVDGEGTYLICSTCIEEAAGLIGMVSEDAADALLCRSLELEMEVTNLTEELAETTALLSALRRYDDRVSDRPATDPGSEVPSPSDPGRIAAAVDDELAKGPVLEFACPGDEPDCTRRFTSAAAAGAHAFRVHGRRTAK